MFVIKKIIPFKNTLHLVFYSDKLIWFENQCKDFLKKPFLLFIIYCARSTRGQFSFALEIIFFQSVHLVNIGFYTLTVVCSFLEDPVLGEV